MLFHSLSLDSHRDVLVESVTDVGLKRLSGETVMKPGREFITLSLSEQRQRVRNLADVVHSVIIVYCAEVPRGIMK